MSRSRFGVRCNARCAVINPCATASRPVHCTDMRRSSAASGPSSRNAHRYSATKCTATKRGDVGASDLSMAARCIGTIDQMATDAEAFARASSASPCDIRVFCLDSRLARAETGRQCFWEAVIASAAVGAASLSSPQLKEVRESMCSPRAGAGEPAVPLGGRDCASGKLADHAFSFWRILAFEPPNDRAASGRHASVAKPGSTPRSRCLGSPSRVAAAYKSSQVAGCANDAG